MTEKETCKKYNDIEKIKQILNNFSIKYRESFRGDDNKGVSYPITNVNLLTIDSHLLQNDSAYGVGLEIVFDMEGKFIGFEPYGDQ